MLQINYINENYTLNLIFGLHFSCSCVSNFLPRINKQFSAAIQSSAEIGQLIVAYLKNTEEIAHLATVTKISLMLKNNLAGQYYY